MTRKYADGTSVIHAGLKKAVQGQPFNNEPIFAGTYHLAGDPASSAYQYGRFTNPTWEALENAIAELEGGPAVVFPSGMAAITAVMNSLLQAGDTIVLPSDGYYATSEYFRSFLEKFAVKGRWAPTLEIPKLDFTGVKLVLVESPSNPMLDVVDIRGLSVAVHKAGGLLAIDNTTLTALGQQPLLLGADISIASDTKAFNGHSDLLFGHVAANDKAIVELIHKWRKFSGSIPGPMEAWLAHRGLATLDMRLQRMVSNAQHVAEMLSQHRAVKMLRYPGLTSDPSHTISKLQTKHFGFIISFELENKASAEKFLSHLQLVFESTSFGGLHTMAERRARWGTDPISEGVIRMSVGCEHVDDILEDIKAALNKL